MSNRNLKCCDYCEKVIAEDSQFLEMKVDIGTGNSPYERAYDIRHLHNTCVNDINPNELLKLANIEFEVFNRDS